MTLAPLASASALDPNPCASNTTRPDCATPALRQQSKSIDAALYSTEQDFYPDDEQTKPVIADLNDSQQKFHAAILHCANANCMAQLNTTRLAELTYHARPGAPAPTDHVAGIYKNDLGTISLQVRDNTTLRLALLGADPKGAWMCNLAGLVTLDGSTLTMHQTLSGPPILTLTMSANTLTIPETDLNTATSMSRCGANGYVTGNYTKQ